jgi:tetratricopeptide (TPR) repeat protein
MSPAVLFREAERFHKRGDLPAASSRYRQLVEADHQFVPALFGLALIAYQLRQFHSARIMWERCLDVLPLHYESHYNLGTMLMELGEFAAARPYLQTAVTLKDRPEALTNFGLLVMGDGQYAEAIAHFDRASHTPHADPAGKFNRAFANLMLGRFTDGWADYEGRWEAPIFAAEYRRSYAQTRWHGERGHLFLWAEQGFGDTLMMWRYLPQLRERVDQLTVEVQPALMTLLREHLPPDTHLIEAGMIPPDFDSQLPMMSLPYEFGTTLDAIPPAPYLTAPHGPAILPETGRKIGLVWAGARRHRNDARRSIPPGMLAPLFQVPGIDWFSLQVDRLDELGTLDASSLPDVPFYDLRDHLTNFAATARVIAALDLVITVDTAVAHLAGALGIPCWVLIPPMPDFRWLLGRTDSPWYPSLRLFRRERLDGDWASTILEVAEALRG